GRFRYRDERLVASCLCVRLVDRRILWLAALPFSPPPPAIRIEAGTVVPLLQPLDEFEAIGAARRFDDLRFARLGAAVADVVANRAVQQRGVLRHHADLCT